MSILLSLRFDFYYALFCTRLYYAQKSSNQRSKGYSGSAGSTETARCAPRRAPVSPAEPAGSDEADFEPDGPRCCVMGSALADAYNVVGFCLLVRVDEKRAASIPVEVLSWST